MLTKLPISVMVVGYNEGKLLPACLESIRFCDEILYTDLGSSDNSIEIAKQYNAIIYKRDKANVPSGEIAQAEVVNYTKNEWVIFIDPDEVVDIALQKLIVGEFENITSNPLIGAVTVPWQFYFKRRKLLGTIWGGINRKFFLVNKHRFDFLPITHYGRTLKIEFTQYDVPENKGKTNVLHHYWMNSYVVFIKKHLRYLKKEGTDEYNRHRRSSIKKIMLSPFKEFYFSMFTKKGYKDLLIGLFLSIFWAFYKTSVAIGIFKVQIAQKRKLDGDN
jgi:glycosyltransferase involved in cell wall biosynthesis